MSAWEPIPAHESAHMVAKAGLDQLGSFGRGLQYFTAVACMIENERVLIEWNPTDQGAARARPNVRFTNRRPSYATASGCGNGVTVVDFGLTMAVRALALRLGRSFW
eukprot:6784350-Prymnesium_polylepis.1